MQDTSTQERNTLLIQQHSRPSDNTITAANTLINPTMTKHLVIGTTIRVPADNEPQKVVTNASGTPKLRTRRRRASLNFHPAFNLNDEAEMRKEEQPMKPLERSPSRRASNSRTTSEPVLLSLTDLATLLMPPKIVKEEESESTMRRYRRRGSCGF